MEEEEKIEPHKLITYMKTHTGKDHLKVFVQKYTKCGCKHF